jgi:putative aldouronate transport system substrate-binding protein
MKKYNVKIAALLILVFWVFSIFVGCSKNGKSDEFASTSQADKTDASTTSQETHETLEPDLPITKEKIKLTMFTTFPAGHAAYFKTLNDSPNFQALEEATNIEVDITAVPEVNFDERKNLLFASRDLTDIIYTNTLQEDALLYGVNDNLIIPLDDLIKENAYNFNKWIASESGIKEQSIAVNGKMYHIPSIDITLKNSIGVGYYIREAWLEQLNLEPPTTLDELYNVLKAFKENDPAGGGKTLPSAYAIPSYVIEPILGSFGMNNGIFRVKDVVKYAPMEPEYKEALKYVNKLYKENLIPSDYLTYDSDMYKAELLDNIGLTYAWSNGHLRLPLQAAGLTTEESWNTFRPIGGMKGADNIYYWFGSTIGQVCHNSGECISVTNKYPVETIKWIDYKYSQEGAWTVMYGPKGVTWDYDETGAPNVTDFVLNNPDGLLPDEVMYRNGAMEWGYTACAQGQLHRAKPTSHWPFTDDDVDQNMNRFGPNFDSLYSKYWRNWMDFDASRQMPVSIKYTAEEKERIDVLAQDITTLVDENLHKVIMGLEPIEKWDEVVNLLKKMNVDEYISIHQTALDRVLN